MKKQLLFFMLCGLAQVSQAQVSSPDSMVHKLFATLKAKDEKAFVAMYPDAAQMQTLIRNVMQASMGSEEMKQMMEQNPQTKGMNIDSIINAQMAGLSKPEVMEQMRKGFGKSFQQMIEQGEKKGVNWSTINLTDYSFDTSVSTTDEDGAMLAKLGYKNMKGVMDFTSGDSAYRLSFDKAIYIPKDGGWFGGEFQQLIRKGESFAQSNAGEEMMATDTTAAIMDAPKTKTKSSGGKTKVKTKTPARKTKPKS